MYIIPLTTFFLYSSRDHRDLHSFPTRRSSDLYFLLCWTGGGWQPATLRPPDSRILSFCKMRDRKSTRLNSSHPSISYAVFCLKKKKRDPGSVMMKDMSLEDGDAEVIHAVVRTH